MLRQHRIVLTVACALAAAGCSGHAAIPTAPFSIAPQHHRTPSKTGLVLPMYMYPGAAWKEVISAKLAHSTVPMWLIANVNNGPGNGTDQTYVKYIHEAQKAGIDVMGYVYTQYGKRAASAIDADMLAWQTRYGADGIFLDEMKPNDPAYYTAATTYAHGANLWFVMGNPGVDAPGNAGPDAINYYEQRNYPSLTFMKKPAHLQYAAARWSYMAGAVPYNATDIAERAPYVGFFYVTDGAEPECYCKLPTYFNQLVALLDSL